MSVRMRLFECPVCHAEGWRERTYQPVTDRPLAYKGEEDPVPVICGVDGCQGVMDQVLRGQGRDLLPEGFVIGDVDGKGERRISSLSELRQIERESERRHRNGEGQILNFREFSQDRQNRQTNSLAGSSYETGRSQRPTRRTTGRRSELPIQVRPTRG